VIILYLGSGSLFVSATYVFNLFNTGKRNKIASFIYGSVLCIGGIYGILNGKYGPDGKRDKKNTVFYGILIYFGLSVIGCPLTVERFQRRNAQR